QVKAGVVLNPATPVNTIAHVLEEVDLILLMTVNPGFGGQSFIEAVLPNIKQARALVNERQLPIEIEVDGGVNEETVKLCAEAGADVFVAGSAIFNKEDRKAALQSIRN